MSLSKYFKLIVCAALCMTAVVQAPHVNALPYLFTDLGAGSFAAGINNSGQVAGNVVVGGATHATVWNGTNPTDLGTGEARGINNFGQVVGNSNGQATLWNGTTAAALGSFQALGINDSGLVVGNRIDPGADSRAVLWNGTSAVELAPGAAGVGFASAINNVGQITGSSRVYLVDPSVQVTVWNGAGRTQLGSLGNFESFGNDINDLGQVAGASFANVPGLPFEEQHAALWNGTTPIDLGGKFSWADAINNQGQIVGWDASVAESRAILWQNGAMIDLNSFLDASTIADGWILRTAKDINDRGWIVGSAFNSITGQSHAFVLTPLPEPQIYATMVIGLGILGFVAHRRRKLSNQPLRRAVTI